MKLNFYLFITTIMTALYVHAQSLNCTARLNSEFIFTNHIKPELNTKILIGREESFTAYITQIEHSHFILEAFIVNKEARIYSEGNLEKVNDELKLSIWSRDEIVDIDCRLVHD